MTGPRIEIGLLAALAFFLPLYEAPKNLLWAAYVLAWIVNRVCARDFGGRWDGWDTLLAVWFGASLAAVAAAGLHGNEWRGTLDLLRYGGVLWLAKRSRYSPRELYLVMAALVASVVVGLAYAHVRLLNGELPDLQLNSVGHVNHTAIYLAIMLGVCAAWLFATWPAWPLSRRAVALSITLLILVSVVATASRAAVGAAVLVLLALAATWWPRWRAPLVASVVALAIAAGALFVVGAEVIRKHESNVQANNVLAFRDSIWRAALVAWRKYPWAGVGLDNYSLISSDKLRAWRRSEAGADYDGARYLPYAHAHSLYLNTLAERGLIGAAALAALLLAWLVALARRRPRPPHAALDWLLWGSAAGAWLVTVAAGGFNTTLHDEHGILAALLLGLWLGHSRTSAADKG